MTSAAKSPLRRLPLSGRGHQPRGLALLPLSAEPAHGRRDAGPHPDTTGWSGRYAFTGAVAKFWRLPRVEHAGGIGASELEVPHDPERDCREAEAPLQG